MLHILISLILAVSLSINLPASANAPNDLVEQIFSGYEKVKNKNTCSENKKDGFYIFVSLNLPKNLLRDYNRIAKRIGAKLVLIPGFTYN